MFYWAPERRELANGERKRGRIPPPGPSAKSAGTHAGGLKVKWHALGWKELIKEFASNSIGSEMLELEAT